MEQELITYIIHYGHQWMRPAELRALHRVSLTERGEIMVKQAALAEKKN